MSSIMLLMWDYYVLNVVLYDSASGKGRNYFVWRDNAQQPIRMLLTKCVGMCGWAVCSSGTIFMRRG